MNHPDMHPVWKYVPFWIRVKVGYHVFPNGRDAGLCPLGYALSFMGPRYLFNHVSRSPSPSAFSAELKLDNQRQIDTVSEHARDFVAKWDSGYWRYLSDLPYVTGTSAIGNVYAPFSGPVVITFKGEIE